MKHPLPLLSVSLLASGLLAQAPTFTVQTRGAYGVVAEDEKDEVVNGLADATVLTAATTRLAAALPGCQASTLIHLARGRFGRGVVVNERGFVFNHGTEGSRLAATLDEESPTDHSAPHTLTLIVDGATATEGTVTITWGAWGSEHAEASCSVDLNDDQIPDFTGEANEHPVVQEFLVQRVGRRFVIHLTTQAEAEIDGRGWAAYAGRLGIYFREGAPGAAMTSYGRECGGHIDGTTESGTVAVSLSGAAANSLGLMLIGGAEVNVGLGTCTLLTLPAVVVPFQTNAQGAASHDLPLPPVGSVDLRVQHLIVQGGIAGTNGLRIQR